MPRVQSQPSADLRNLVRYHWHVDQEFRPERDFLITPDCSAEVVISASTISANGGGKTVLMPACFGVGLLNGPVSFRFSGRLRCLGSSMLPVALGRLFPRVTLLPGLAVHDLTPIFVETRTRLLRCAASGRFAEGLELLDQVLKSLLASCEHSSASKRAARTFETLASRASPTVKDIARSEGLSVRQLERNLSESARIAPKRVMTLARFERVRNRIWNAPDVPSSRLVFEEGFADQAHLCRDFRRYSGMTVRAFRSHCLELRLGD